jgi:hypothetical protein
MRSSTAMAFVLILAASSTIIVKPTSAQTKPSIPEFALKFVDNSYYVYPTPIVEIDPYTGKQTVTTYPSYQIQNRTIEVTIRNQQFTPYSDENQHMINLFYYFSFKGHFEDTWSYYPRNFFSKDSDEIPTIPQSTSDYTVVLFNDYTFPFKTPAEGQMDFRVQAQIGYYNVSMSIIPEPGAPFTVYNFVGQVSGWSNTQGITIPASTSSPTLPRPTPSLPYPPSPSPTSTLIPSESPTQTTTLEPSPTLNKREDNFVPLAVAAGLVIAMVVVIALLVFKKIKKQK